VILFSAIVAAIDSMIPAGKFRCGKAISGCSTASLDKRSLRARIRLQHLETAMDRFIHCKTCFFTNGCLAETNVKKDQVRHALLLRLLEAELAKDKRPSAIE
jgi:hypothetical protein